MELKRLSYPYPYIPVSERAALLPLRSVCSIAPAEDPADALYTGNGSHRIDVTGQPYRDSLTANMELLQEPKWKETPQPPDLRPGAGPAGGGPRQVYGPGRPHLLPHRIPADP